MNITRRNFLKTSLLAGFFVNLRGAWASESQSSSVPKEKSLKAKAEHSLMTYVAGAPYHIDDDVEAVFHVGQHLKVIPEPDNLHDSRAIALYCDTTKVGYVPRKVNHVLVEPTKNKRPIHAVVTHVEPDSPWDGVEISLRWSV